MGWDIFVQDLPRDAKTVVDIPDDFKPAVIGARSEVISKIKEVVPTANFSDPSWGLIDGNDWSIELNMGRAEECVGFVFHVRGGEDAVGVVAAILQHLDLRALDSQTGELFVAGPEALASFKKWRAYGDGIVDQDGEVPVSF